MICEEARTLLHAYLDGELELTSSLEVESHLKSCTACTQEQANLQMVRAAFSNGALYYQAPRPLERRVRRAVRDEYRAEYGRGFALRYLGWAGAAAAVLLLAIILKGIQPLQSPSELTVREVVDDHLRSLSQNHLTDVLSSNQHTVKPWFDGRLNFAPPVVDLATEGFPMVGGRLDYLDNRPVAAVVYRRRQHIINVFISPAPTSNDSNPITRMRAGYSVVNWTESGMKYWAVSSLNASELEKFAEMLQQQAR